MRIQYLRLVFVSVILFVLPIIAFGLPPSVCSSASTDNPNTWIYKKKGTDFYIQKSANPYDLMPIDTVESSERTSVITFKPQTVTVNEGENVSVAITREGSVESADNWYAIYTNMSETFGKGLQLLPFEASVLPDDDSIKSIQSRLLPVFKAFYKGSIVYEQSGSTETAPDVNIRKINGSSSNLSLNTEDLEPGYYWFTLQAEVTTDKKELCQKTTHPVLIRVKPIVIYPTELDLEADVTCPPEAVLTATATDKNVPARDLTIKDWKIRDQNGNDITSSVAFTTRNLSKYSQELKITSELKNGNYSIEATASNGVAPDTLKKIPFTVSCVVHRPSGEGAGIAYFGNATPDYRKGEIIDKPEEWTKNTEMKRKAPAARYPRTEFETFYRVTGADTPQIDPFSNNSETIERIITELKLHPNSTIYVLGYADYRATRGYSNISLAKARVKSVVKRLKTELKKSGLANRIIGSGLTAYNCGANTSRSKRGPIWSDKLRWERRVEIIYGYGDKVPAKPNYANQCKSTNIDLSK